MPAKKSLSPLSLSAGASRMFLLLGAPLILLLGKWKTVAVHRKIWIWPSLAKIEIQTQVYFRISEVDLSLHCIDYVIENTPLAYSSRAASSIVFCLMLPLQNLKLHQHVIMCWCVSPLTGKDLYTVAINFAFSPDLREYVGVVGVISQVWYVCFRFSFDGSAKIKHTSSRPALTNSLVHWRCLLLTIMIWICQQLKLSSG